MLKIEARQLFRSNGLIDDLVVYGDPDDYLELSRSILNTAHTGELSVIATDSPISIEVSKDDEREELFTSLQNKDNVYLSLDAWNARNILRVFGNRAVLESLSTFFESLSREDEGYSYLSEYSEKLTYSDYSPEWRLHVKST